MIVLSKSITQSNLKPNILPQESISFLKCIFHIKVRFRAQKMHGETKIIKGDHCFKNVIREETKGREGKKTDIYVNMDLPRRYYDK
jgi:hypothetical protein